jgi:hypothetical protein
MRVTSSLAPREPLLTGYVALVALSCVTIGPLYVTSDSYEFRRFLVDENQVVETATNGFYLLGALVAGVVLLMPRARVHTPSQLTFLLLCVFALLEEHSYFRDGAPFYMGNSVPIDTLHDVNVAVADRFGVGVLLAFGLVPLIAVIIVGETVGRFLRWCSTVHPGWPYTLIAVVLVGIALMVDTVEYRGTLPGGILLEELLELWASIAMAFAAGAGLLAGAAPAAETATADPEGASLRREV